MTALLVFASVLAIAAVACLLGLVTGWIARRRGMDGEVWWAAGTACFPLALVAVLVARPERWRDV